MPKNLPSGFRYITKQAKRKENVIWIQRIARVTTIYLNKIPKSD